MWDKRDDMVVHGEDPYNAEPPPGALAGRPVTATDTFYSRNHGPVPDLDATSWRLTVDGLVEHTLDLGLADLQERFEHVTLAATLQCAGNRRIGLLGVRDIPGEAPWGPAATSTATWTGVRLADVLRAAGVDPAAGHVAFQAPDLAGDAVPEQGYGSSIPLGKALGEEVLLAWEMNGAALTPIHGAPVRVVVPGWIGARSVKWVTRVSVQQEPSASYFQSVVYRLLPPDADPSGEPGRGFALGPVALNADVLSPADGATVEPGPVEVTGYAYAGEQRRVARVDVSLDGGATWVQAELAEPDGDWTWVMWRTVLDLATGPHEVTVRAWDSTGATQPASPADVWNPKGYVNNSWARVRLTAGRRSNWAGNIVFGAARVHRPESVDALRRLVADADRVRALGSGHSFNALADTVGDLVDTAGLPRAVEVDVERRSAQVSGGVRYGELSLELARAGLALPNTGSLPHISVAGACATGTHGSGTTNQVLAASVSSVTLVGPEGDLRTVTRADPDFEGSVLALGRLGIVTSLTLDLVPDFQVAQTVVEGVRDEVVGSSLEAILSSAYSVSVFTEWSPVGTNRVWVKEKVGREQAWSGSELWGGALAAAALNPVAGMPAENATAQLGEPGPWYERLPHFRLEFLPSTGDELQSEYLVPMQHASAAWERVAALRERIAPLLLVCELRAVAADPLWLSLTGGQDCAAFHFTWVNDTEAVRPVLRALEQELAELGARPHWGKVSCTPPQTLAALYPRLPDFRRLVTEVDPDGTFGNDLVDGWIGLA